MNELLFWCVKSSDSKIILHILDRQQDLNMERKLW